MELTRRVLSSDFIRITAQSSPATPCEPAPIFGMHPATLPRLISLAQRTRSPSKSHRRVRPWVATTTKVAILRLPGAVQCTGTCIRTVHTNPSPCLAPCTTESHGTAGLSLACGFLLQLNSTPIRWRRETINFSTYRILYRPMPATLIPPARLSDFLSTLRKTLMGSCSARASSLPSTFQGQTWFRHRHAVSILGATSSGSMYLKTPQGYRTHTDSSQRGTRTKSKKSRLSVWSKISNALKRLGFRSRNFLAQLVSETSRACTIRVRRSSFREALECLGRACSPMSPEQSYKRECQEKKPPRWLDADLFFSAFSPTV